MPRTFAEIAPDRTVLRVVVCDDPSWLEANLGGEWVETHTDDDVVSYTGPGHGHDPDWPCRFAPQWVQPFGAGDDAHIYHAGDVRFHFGHLWVSTVDNNVWEPGVSGWRQIPTEPGVPPEWTAPTGAHDVWRMGETVTHLGKTWRSTNDANVWEPGVFGWEEVT